MTPVDFRDELGRKAERLARARQRRKSLFQALVHVGALGWMFVLPVVLGAIGGRLLAHAMQRPYLKLPLLLAGLLVGGYAVFRELRRSLEDRP